MKYICALFFSLVLGCTTLGLRPDTVIERSAPERPSWVEGVYTDETPSSVSLTFAKPEIYRLELGIKQAQAAAAQNTQKLVIDRVLVELERYRRRLNKNKTAAFNKAAAELYEKYKSSSEATPKSVYWEKVKRETPEGPKTDYTVYSLLSISRNEFNYALKLAAKSIQVFPEESARVIGTQILKDLANDVILKD